MCGSLAVSDETMVLVLTRLIDRTGCVWNHDAGLHQAISPMTAAKWEKFLRKAFEHVLLKQYLMLLSFVLKVGKLLLPVLLIILYIINWIQIWIQIDYRRLILVNAFLVQKII